MKGNSAVRALSRAGLLAEAFVLAICARVALRFLALDSVTHLMGVLPRRRLRDGQAIGECLEAASMASARVAHPTCLYRSLVALGLLARRGYPVAIHIGVSRDGGFFAHAWLTVADRPVDSPPPRAYSALWRYSPGAPRPA
jgi:hypothetical protein